MHRDTKCGQKIKKGKEEKEKAYHMPDRILSINANQRFLPEPAPNQTNDYLINK